MMVDTRTIAFYVNMHRERAREIAARAAAIAREVGYAVALPHEQDDVLHLATPEATIEGAELLVTIGGDGTLLRGVHLAAPFGVPVLGINTGRLGFLTEFEGSLALDDLRSALEVGFFTETRAALSACINGGEKHFALNDVVVRRSANARMAPFGLSLDGELVAHIPADGVIVSTATGSTAYFLSAGGPIISPGVDAFGIIALLPHTLFARPLIVPTTSLIEIICDPENVRATLEVDGMVVAELEPNDVVTVRRTPIPVRFARTRPQAFFSRLQEKLQWGVPIKRQGE